jgi:hypothetical protein
MLEDSRMKVRVECVRILTEIPQGDRSALHESPLSSNFLLRNRSII